MRVAVTPRARETGGSARRASTRDGSPQLGPAWLGRCIEQARRPRCALPCLGEDRLVYRPAYLSVSRFIFPRFCTALARSDVVARAGRSASEPNGWSGGSSADELSADVLAKPAEQLGGQAPAMALRNWARRGSVAAEQRSSTSIAQAGRSQSVGGDTALTKPIEQLGGQAPAMALRNWARRGSDAALQKGMPGGAKVGTHKLSAMGRSKSGARCDAMPPHSGCCRQLSCTRCTARVWVASAFW